MNKVEVRPVPGKKWHGKEGKESFKRPEVIRALVDPQTLEYATGLDEKDLEYLKNKVNYDLTSQYHPENPHPFWDGSLAQIKMKNSTMFFDPKNPLDYIKIRMLKASKFCANSEREWEEGLWPEANFIIRNEAEEEEVVAGKVELRNKAVIEASKLSHGKKVQMVMYLNGKNIKKASNQTVTLEIDKAIKSNPEKFLRTIQMDSKQLATHAMVLEAIQKGVFREKAGKILYMDQVIGIDKEEVVLYLMDDNNQDLKIRIMEVLND